LISSVESSKIAVSKMLLNWTRSIIGFVIFYKNKKRKSTKYGKKEEN